MNKRVLTIAILTMFQLCPGTGAAILKPETRAAWNVYLQAANAAMQERLQPGAHFLWIDEQPGRAEQVRTHGPYIQPINRQIPEKVQSGLIHEWLGVGFVPKATIQDMLRVVRAYDRYKDVYRPGVIESTSHGSDGSRDLFSLRLANRSVVAKTALDMECTTVWFQVDHRRWYGVSTTVAVREIERSGTPEQRSLPEDTGTGLIWRLSSITRLEERDGGVYAELEAIALSRDIPAAFRLFVTPIVRRVSRDSLANSLHQTKVAVTADISSREGEIVAR